MGEVDQPVGGEPEVLPLHQLPERAVVRLAGSPTRGQRRRRHADRTAVGGRGEEHTDLLERLADDADPVRERQLRVLEPERRRRGRGIETGAPAERVGRVVLARELAAGKYEVAGGELAFRVSLHQQDVEAAGGAVAEQHERRGGHRDHRGRFDGHGVV